ncbi:hypothetical protein BDZ91DRAFT_367825 [Kalaharituber pfeilii]|nr:hypothetical protein BDZ91DRAFT_367825 [Kalaharituber pfeilii]
MPACCWNSLIWAILILLMLCCLCWPLCHRGALPIHYSTYTVHIRKELTLRECGPKLDNKSNWVVGTGRNWRLGFKHG